MQSYSANIFGAFNIYADLISKKSPLFPCQPLKGRKGVFQDSLHEAIAYFSLEKDSRRMFSFTTCTIPQYTSFTRPKFCIIIVCKFSWDMKMSKRKSKTMPMQNFGGLKRCIMGFAQVVNYKNLPQSSLQFRCILVVHCLPRWNAWLLRELYDSCCMCGQN